MPIQLELPAQNTINCVGLVIIDRAYVIHTRKWGLISLFSWSLLFNPTQSLLNDEGWCGPCRFN